MKAILRQLIGQNRYRRLFDGRWRIYRTEGERPVAHGPALPLWAARGVTWLLWQAHRKHVAYSLGRKGT